MSLLVRDVMTPHATAVPPDMTVEELERLLVGSRLGGAPVTTEGRLVGVVAQADIVRRLLADVEEREHVALEYHREVSGCDVPLSEWWKSADLDRASGRLHGLTVADIMSDRPITVEADETLEHAGKIMLDRQVHRVIVVEHEHLVGVLTALDIVRCYCAP
jgi:CBS domain-containing protein